MKFILCLFPSKIISPIHDCSGENTGFAVFTRGQRNRYKHGQRLGPKPLRTHTLCNLTG